MSEKKKVRPSYSREFKTEAVAKCLKIGISQASRELGVCAASLRSWKEKAEQSTGSSPGKPSYEQLEMELKKLKREMGYIRDINEVLKKSTAIFSSSEMGALR